MVDLKSFLLLNISDSMNNASDKIDIFAILLKGFDVVEGSVQIPRNVSTSSFLSSAEIVNVDGEDGFKYNLRPEEAIIIPSDEGHHKTISKGLIDADKRYKSIYLAEIVAFFGDQQLTIKGLMNDYENPIRFITKPIVPIYGSDERPIKVEYVGKNKKIEEIIKPKVILVPANGVYYRLTLHNPKGP